jgi:hypothetical protein
VYDDENGFGHYTDEKAFSRGHPGERKADFGHEQYATTTRS